MKITLWVPSSSKMAWWRCISSWWNLETPDNIKPRLYPGCQVANNIIYSWNDAVLDFLASGDDWLLSWHDDVVGDPKTLMRLLSWDKPLISALIFMRTAPVTPHIWKSYDTDSTHYAQRVIDTRRWFYAHKDYIAKFQPFVMEPRPDDALVEDAGFTSTSCMLIHRDVLEAMRQEVNDVWFKLDDDRKGGGEDRRFCEHARLAGYPLCVDRSCVVEHLVGDIGTCAADFFAWDSVSTIYGTGEPHEIVK